MAGLYTSEVFDLAPQHTAPHLIGEHRNPASTTTTAHNCQSETPLPASMVNDCSRHTSTIRTAAAENAGERHSRRARSKTSDVYNPTISRHGGGWWGVNGNIVTRSKTLHNNRECYNSDYDKTFISMSKTYITQ